MAALSSAALAFGSFAAMAPPAPLHVVVTVQAGKSLRAVPPLFYGQNIEWTNSGDGLWDAKAGSVRPDVARLLRSLRPALVRFPGGSLSNAYQWQDAVGPVVTRKPITTYFNAASAPVNGAWGLRGGSVQLPVYGFDEQLKLVKQIGAAGSLITVNATYYPATPQWSGSPQQAAAWVAYANGRVDGPDAVIGKDWRGMDWRDSRYWAGLRVRNGHSAPYNVMNWEIGNEVDDRSQGAGMTGSVYARRVHEYARAMMAVDPRIRIGAVLGFNWLPDLLRTAGRDISFLIYHNYGPNTGSAALNLWANGERNVTIETRGGPTTVVFRASGTPAQGVWPEMVVSVDGKEVDRFSVSADSTRGHVDEYRVTSNLSPGHHRLSVAFVNDLMTTTEDRNLFIHQAWVENAGQRQPIDWVSPAEMLRQVAEQPAIFAARFAQIRSAVRRYLPARQGQIQVYLTEFNAMYTNADVDARQIKDLKSALMVDGILQRALDEPLCVETNFWCLNSWYFRIVELGPHGAYLSPAGDVYQLFTDMGSGTVVPAVVTSPVLVGTTPAVPAVSAVAIRNGRRLTVNLLNFDGDSPASVVLDIRGMSRIRFARARALVGPSADATNEPEAPLRVHLAPLAVKFSGRSARLVVPAHSAATVVLGE